MQTSGRRRILGGKVRDLRGAGGEHQEAFAARAGIGARTLVYIEMGQKPYPQAVTLAKIAAALGVTVDEITAPADNGAVPA